TRADRDRRARRVGRPGQHRPSTHDPTPGRPRSACGRRRPRRRAQLDGRPRGPRALLTMHALYLFSVWVHILAATVWVGGMLFLVLVVVPWLRKGGRTNAGIFLRETGERFRNVGWVCFGLVLVAGTFSLWVRGVRLSHFASADWLGPPFGKTVVVKLSAFLLVLVVSAVHDFVVGPRATR